MKKADNHPEKALKIAVFGHKQIPSRIGGVEVAVEALTVRLAQRGHHVICYNRSVSTENRAFPTERYKGVQLKSVFTIHGKGIAAATSSVSAALAASVSSADIVHIHAEGPAAMCWLPKLFGKQVIVTIHGLDWKRAKWGSLGSWYLRQGERIAASFADEIIVVSLSLQRYFREIYHKETAYIPNGVERPVFRGTTAIFEKFGLQKDGYFLFVGRIVPEKGLQYLIKAFQKIKTEKRLVIVGTASDTNGFLNELKRMTAGDNQILFTGFVQGELLEALYHNTYVYVLPSDLEGMSLSLLEAMMYGNCCLVSDIAECVEVVENKAVLFRKGDITDLAEKLQLLCDESGLVEYYRSVSRQHVSQGHNWNEIVDATLRLYRGNE